jgi:hypothetical protein
LATQAFSPVSASAAASDRGVFSLVGRELVTLDASFAVVVLLVTSAPPQATSAIVHNAIVTAEILIDFMLSPLAVSLHHAITNPKRGNFMMTNRANKGGVYG